MKLETNLKELFSKYLAGQASPSELLQLLDHFQEENDSMYLRDLISAELEKEEDAPGVGQQRILSRVSVALHDRIRAAERKAKRLYWGVSAAAAVLLCVGGWLGLRHTDSEPTSTDPVYSAILPGEDRAILHLEDGRVLDLDSLVDDSDLYLSKESGGMMTFNTDHLPASADKTGQRTLSTPRGGQFAVVLSDGTKVWLNASSSLTYPTHFVGGKRQVTLKGEAYFEVAKDVNKPFEVLNEGQVVEVLGTSFNITAYPEEKMIKTTLLEGRVKIALPGKEMFKMLRPNQQSTIESESASIAVKTVDPESAIAWKNGYFMFDDEDFESIMKKVAKWYDVDVVYESKPQNIAFIGAVSRSKNISEVLHALERTGKVKFKISGKTVTVI